MGGEEKQYTNYYCADVTIMQICYELFGLDLSQSWIASLAGTTTLGTSHEGINSALKTIAKKYGTLSVLNGNPLMMWVGNN